jgi:FkbM family methyltransferase
MFYLRLKKLLFLMGYPRLMKALIQYRVLASVEHQPILSIPYKTIVDIGANKGQFALACRALAPHAKVISFEPLPQAADLFRDCFKGDPKVSLHHWAIGPTQSKALMHISARDDSSSLLPMGNEQVKTFPGTQEVGVLNVDVAPLNYFLKRSDICAPALLKIDVQGYEFEVLLGCENLLHSFDHIYCECSFVELYTGQKLVASIVDWLYQRGFSLAGIHNMSYDDFGKAIQADFLFERSSSPLMA